MSLQMNSGKSAMLWALQHCEYRHASISHCACHEVSYGFQLKCVSDPEKQQLRDSRADERIGNHLAQLLRQDLVGKVDCMPRIVSRPSSSMMSSRSTFESRHASSSNSAMTSPIPSTLSSQNCHSNTVSRVSTVEKCYQPSNDSCGTVLLVHYAFQTQVCMYPLVGPEDNDGISVRIDEQSI